jgi:hypothetical protein
MGIFSLKDMEYSRDAMVSGLKNPKVEINKYYISALSVISIPKEMFSAVKPDADDNGKYLERSFAFAKLQEEPNNYERKFLDVLYESISRRKGRNLANACYLLLKNKHEYGYGGFLKSKDAESDLPDKYAEKSELRKTMASVFVLLEPSEKAGLLEGS